jgi:hypothetical protein
MGRRVACLSAMFIICLAVAGSTFSDERLPSSVYQAHFSEDDLVITQKLGFDVIGLKGCLGTQNWGHPDLPVEFIHIVLPPGCTAVSASVTGTEERRLGDDFFPFPAQPDLKTDGMSGNTWIEPDPAVYNSSSSYPASMVEIVGQGYLAGNHMVTLAVVPFQYQPESGGLSFYTRLDIEIGLNPAETPASATPMQIRMPYAEDLYQGALGRLASDDDEVADVGFQRVWQASSNIGSGSTDYYQYLIVTSDELASSFQPLAEWKTKKGVKANVVSLDSIMVNYTGRDDAEKLRNFLIQAYNQGTLWVLLGGDEDVVPVRYAYPTNTSSNPSKADQQICDLYFSDVDGEWDLDDDGVWGEPQHDSPDIYPDLFVGRVPANTSEEVSAFVEKLLAYEKNPGDGTYDYLTRALWMSSDQMRDWDEGTGQHNLLAPYIPASFDQDLTTLIESPSGDAGSPIGPDGETCVDQMNQGWGIIGVLAHGKSSGFVAKSNLTNGDPKSWVLTYPGDADGQGHMTNLGNHQEYGIMYSISCSQSALDVDKYPYMGGEPCVAEFYPLIAGKGGVAFLGYTRWGWVGVSYKLLQVFLESLFDDELDHHLGVAEALSRCAYPGYRDIDYGHNLFGDPEMPVWTEAPSQFLVIHPEQVTLGKRNVILLVSSQGIGVGEAQVCMTLRGETLFLGETDQDGQISCGLDLDDVGEMSLVVTKPNFIPYEDSITISLAADADDDADDQTGMWSFDLCQNHPNPFNPSTGIRYTVGGRQTHTPTLLRIYNVLGQRVRTLVDEEKKPGQYRVIWDGKDDNHSDVSSGIYFCVLEIGESRDTKKMVLIR